MRQSQLLPQHKQIQMPVESIAFGRLGSRRPFPRKESSVRLAAQQTDIAILSTADEFTRQRIPGGDLLWGIQVQMRLQKPLQFTVTISSSIA